MFVERVEKVCADRREREWKGLGESTKRNRMK